MINVRILLRRCASNYIKPKTSSTNFCTVSSSSSSSSDDEKKNLQKKKSDEAKEKLSLLLTEMAHMEPATLQLKPKLDLAKAVDQKKKKLQSESETEVKVDPAKQLQNAIKVVAKLVGGDAKQTEAELLQKLLHPTKEESTSTPNNLSDVVKGMKIDTETKPSRSQQVRQILEYAKRKDQLSRTQGVYKRPVRRHEDSDVFTNDQIIEDRVNLFGQEPLGIFPPVAEVNTWPEQNLNKTWNILEERELRLAITHPPANYFQQMIQWTEQGKIWKFPIDNEQDMDAEKSVYFTEHLFLDKHIDSWCPAKGPIRVFMELVLVGLSKNPHLSVEDKKEHIEWFRSYFNEKQTLLKEVEAVSADFEFYKDKPQQIEAS